MPPQQPVTFGADEIQQPREVSLTIGGSAPAPITFSAEDISGAPDRGRELSPEEDAAIVAHVKSLVPEKSNYFQSTLEGARAEARHMPAPVSAGTLLWEGTKAFGSAWDPRPLLKLAGETMDPTDPYESAVRFAGKVLQGIASASADQGQQALEKARAGDYVGAVGHALGATPLIGPPAAAAGEKIATGYQTGDPVQMARGIGEGLGLISTIGLPEAVAQVAPKVAAVLPEIKIGPREPAQQSALDFALRKDIPFGARQATGNRFVAGQAANVNETLGGSIVADPAQQATREAMTRVGEEMRGDIYPSPVGRYEAGQAVQRGLQDVREVAGQTAKQQYRALEDIEQRPELAEVLPVQRSAAEVAATEARARATLGRAPTAEEWAELRRIREELEQWQYEDRTWTEAPGKQGNAAGGDYDIVAGHGNAPVYRDIMNAYAEHFAELKPPGAAPSASRYVPRDPVPGPQLRQALDKAIQTGSFDKPAQAALEVARQRIAGATGRLEGGAGYLPPGAGVEYRTMQWPVDIRAEKLDLQPMLDELHHEKQVTGAGLMGDKGKLAVALDAVVNGPDHVPFGTLDDALSDMKRFAYKGDHPTPAQYRMQQAIKRLDARLQATAAEVGPEATRALEGARGAWRARKLVEEMIDELQKEPAETLDQLTARRDRHFDQLKAIDDAAPGVIPQVGRAIMDDILKRATIDGGFKADRAAADWRSLGDKTQELLTGSPARAKDWGDFFTLAKRLEKDLNPSGSAKQGIKWAEAMGGPASLATSFYMGSPWPVVAEVLRNLGNYGIARVMNSPRVARVLLDGLRLPTRSAAAQTAWGGRFQRAAQAAGIPLGGRLGGRPGVPVPAVAAAETEPAAR